MRLFWNSYVVFFIKNLETTTTIFLAYLFFVCVFLLFRYVYYKTKSIAGVSVDNKSTLDTSQNRIDIFNTNADIVFALFTVSAASRIISVCLDIHTLRQLPLFILSSVFIVLYIMKLFEAIKEKYRYRKEQDTLGNLNRKRHFQCFNRTKKTSKLKVKGFFSLIADHLTVIVFLLLPVAVLVLIVFLFFLSLLPCIFFTIIGYGIVNIVTNIAARA